ncbi:carboxymuconolactone decarboxylase family protein [Actinomadura coerulea]|uniref:carboxymuconolactone decarboxylase family protein n=1 Tax=Actinomadura coerulea TaxID=46159 RepID=UPI0034426881
MNGSGFLAAPPLTGEAQCMFDEDIADSGHVMNTSRLWAHRPDLFARLFELLREAGAAAGLGLRERGVLIASCASAAGDSYCALAWGSRLAEASDADTAAAVLRGADVGLTARERALAGWVRKVVGGPHGTAGEDVQELRDDGWDDPQIFAITVFAALRLAFSTVNGALGARPDAAFRATAPPAVLDAVTFGRPIEDETG